MLFRVLPDSNKYFYLLLTESPCSKAFCVFQWKMWKINFVFACYNEQQKIIKNNPQSALHLEMQANYYCSNYLLHYQAKLYSWSELSFLRLNTISNMVLIKFSNSKFFFLSTVFVRLKEPLIVIIENIFFRARIYIMYIQENLS